MSVYYLCGCAAHLLSLEDDDEEEGAEEEGKDVLHRIRACVFFSFFYFQTRLKPIKKHQLLMGGCTGTGGFQQQQQQGRGRRRRPSVDPSCYGAKQRGKPIARLRTEVGKEGEDWIKKKGGMGWMD